MKGITPIIYKIIVIVVVLAISAFMLAIIFGWTWTHWLTLGRRGLEKVRLVAPLVSRGLAYEEWGDMGYDGFVLGRLDGMTSTEITEYLSRKPYKYNCESCSDCSSDFTTCSQCSSCDGKTGNFNNCIVCSSSYIGVVQRINCNACEDIDADYELCERLKSCIYMYASDPEYYEKNGCVIDIIDRREGNVFDTNTLDFDVLKKCKVDDLKWEVGGITKDLCRFDSTDITEFTLDQPYDFYKSEKKVGIPAISFDKIYTIFSHDAERVYDDYRIYAAVKTQYTHSAIPVQEIPSFILLDTIVNVEAGKLKGKELDLSDERNNYMSDYNKNLNIKTLRTLTGNPLFYSGIYYAVPKEKYPYEMRYSHCNLEFDPVLGTEPFTSSNSMSIVNIYRDNISPGAEISSIRRGLVKISLGGLNTTDPFAKGKCKFNIYVCSQDSFAEFADDGILNIIDFFRSFSPLYKNKINDVKVIKSEMVGGYDVMYIEKIGEMIEYNYFEIDLDRTYTDQEIIAAIETGFRDWSRSIFATVSADTAIEWLSNAYNDGMITSRWNGAWDSSITYDNNCWSNNVIGSLEVEENNKLLFYNCPKGQCAGKLKMKIAFKYLYPNNDHPYRYPLYPMITFCSSGSFPDLKVTNILFSNSNPSIGTSVTITTNVYNSGSEEAKNILVRFERKLHRTEGSLIRLGERTINSIPAGGSGTTSVTWTPLSGDEGEWDIIATADPLNSIDEFYDNNNVYTKTLNVR